MDTALPQKFPFILDRNLEKANCTENRVCNSCDTVILGMHIMCYSSDSRHDRLFYSKCKVVLFSYLELNCLYFYALIMRKLLS